MPRLLCTLCLALGFTGSLYAENANNYLELKGTGAVSIGHFSPDGKRVLTGDWILFSIYKTWQLWDAESGKELVKMVGRFGGFASDGKKFAITSIDETDSAEITCIWDTKSGKELHKLKGGFGQFASDGKKIVTSGGYGETYIWDTASGKELHRLKGYFRNFSPDDKKVITAASDSIHLYDVESGKELKKLEGRFGDSHAYISHDGTKMVTSTGGGTSIRTVRIWDAESGEELHKFEGYSASVFFSLDMKKILVNTRGESRILDADSKKVLHKFEGTFSDGSPDGTKIVMTGQEGARIWDTESGKELLKLEHHNATSAYFALEGRKVVTSHEHEGTERIWDAESGKELKLKEDFLSFSPDGKIFMTRSDEGVHIWDIESGKELRRLGEGSEVFVSCAVFSPDGKKIVTSIGTLSEEEKSFPDSYIVRIWDLSATLSETPSEEGEKKTAETVKSPLDLPPDPNEEAELAALREKILAEERAKELALIEEERKIVPLVDKPENLIPLDPQDRIWITQDRKSVVLLGRVVLREGFLELLACRVRSKEHESILSVRVKPQLVHAALLATNARQGRPVQFTPTFSPASGDRIDITLRWNVSRRSLSGEEEIVQSEAPAQDWVWDMSSPEHAKKPMTTHWVFSGSRTYQDAEGKNRYLADETGELFGLSNFVGSILDVPIESSADNTKLQFGCFTERIPPLDTPVTIIITPQK